MKIALLCRNPGLYSHRRLVEAGKARGHLIEVVNHLHCTIDMASRRPRLFHDGFEINDFEAVIPRIGASVTFFGAAVVRQFEMKGVPCVNGSDAITRSRDKLRSLQLLSREDVGIPLTVFAHRRTKADQILELVGGPPTVMKLLEGTGGIGVVLAETRRAAISVIEAFAGCNANILVQEYLAEAHGEDIRCLVVGDRVVASMIRRGTKDDFRSNLHRGGNAEAVAISPDEERTAIRAAEVMDLGVCGVDMLRSSHGPVVMEVNSSPGLEGIETATGIDVAGQIIELIEQRICSNPAERRVMA